MNKELAVRNSTIDFLIFTKESGDNIQAKFFDENVWLSQKLIAKLFDVERSVITKHLKNIFESEELDSNSVSAKFAHTGIIQDKLFKSDFDELINNFKTKNKINK